MRRRIPVVLGGVRHRPHVAAAAPRARPRRTPRAVSRLRRGGDDARALSRGGARRPAACPRPSHRRAPASARAAFDALLAFFDSATGDGRRARRRFCIDEFLDVRTFESFPGLRHVQRELIARLAASPSRFVLASRFTARAHRLLRDAPARFEVVHVPPLDAQEVQSLALLFDGGRREWAGRHRAGRRGAHRPAAPATSHLARRVAVDDGTGDRSGGRAGGAVLARRAADRALPRELRVPAASRARLRRAEGDPRHARGRTSRRT